MMDDILHFLFDGFVTALATTTGVLVGLTILFKVLIPYIEWLNS